MSYDKHPNKDLYDSDATTKSFKAWVKADLQAQPKHRIEDDNPVKPKSQTGPHRHPNPFFSDRPSAGYLSWRKEEPVCPDTVPQ